jgi:Protein of unknown function (DUF616)
VKVAVYTAIMGGYETPKPLPDSLVCPAYLFTDSKATATRARMYGWRAKVVPDRYSPEHHPDTHGDPALVTPMLNHKWWKLHPTVALPDIDVSIWIDGSMEIIVDDFEERCLAALGDDDWAMMRHPARDCIYPEADYSATLSWRYDGPSIIAQANHYRNFYPAGRGLIATGFNVRRHTPIVAEIGEHWWHECIAWSHQDQISLPVLLWLKEELKWNTNLPWGQWLAHHPHG